MTNPITTVKPATFAMPDGRSLYLYGAFSGTPTWPEGEGLHSLGHSHRRWHPVRREWVVYSAHRQTRTFKPAANACPLCPMSPDGEIPVPDFSIAVFDNRFSSLQKDCPKPEPVAGLESLGVVIDSVAGDCEVIVYSADHDGKMGTLPPERRELLVRVWGDRINRLMAELPDVEVVMPFENRGEEAGCTLQHPHGQIYAFPFMPPIIGTMATSFKEGYKIQPLTENETYVVADAENAAAFIPPFARLPYEVWIAPKTFRARPSDMTDAEVADFAALLGKVQRLYDAFFGRDCPYVMLVYAAPRGMEAFFPFHVEFYPTLRTATKLKYLASVEQGAGSFLVDMLPENAVQNLKNIHLEETP